ncbi:ParB/RepB/Spo0J family partition protein [candidate division KSB1 bacterium]|nr:ParB/RepB/Spo0J family partition protein [candidate division KSB1 bacterium]
MANKKALGRGLRALIPDIPPEQEGQAQAIQYIDVNKIAPNPFQPRERFNPETFAELKQSIAEKGLVQPVTVRRHNGGFQLIAGERRWRAVRELGMVEIPAFIMDVKSEDEMLELAIIENVHREDLNPIDIANGYRRLIEECHLTQEEIAIKVGKDRSTVTNFLRLLKLPRRIQESVQNDEITFGHARALLSISSSEDQLNLWKKIVSGHFSVRKVEELVRQSEKKKPKIKAASPALPGYYIQDVENKLRMRLATKVGVKAGQKGGMIEIEYYSADDLNRIIDLILGDS